ncbi:toprim domain-containing protein [Senegalia sp. (in: firmicutes)]|uniref:toprim domain-containing protein n=1 Tax=Senegalia sp. (in: firmicutes) TaxID=1924098 RepID=UPI003F964BAF
MKNRNLIISARQSNLLAYLESRGHTFIREGQHYRSNEHSSLIITPPNAFYWNSKNDGGNSVDFLVRHLGYSFKDAVEALTSERLKQNCSSQQRTEKSNYKINNNHINRAFAYLSKQRNISNDIITYLLENDYIDMLEQGVYQYPVIGFKVKDALRNTLGYEVQGTLDKVRFKGITADLEYGFGFNVIFGSPKKAIFFESAIDLLSFMQLIKIRKLKFNVNDCILISMSGLKVNIIKHMLEAFKINSKPFLAIDNDMAADKLKEDLNTKQIAYSELLVPSPYKDWNEFLKDEKSL